MYLPHSIHQTHDDFLKNGLMARTTVKFLFLNRLKITRNFHHEPKRQTLEAKIFQQTVKQLITEPIVASGTL